MREGAVLATAGVAIGLAAAIAATRVLDTLLFGVSATDALTFTAGAAILLLVACGELDPGAGRDPSGSDSGAARRGVTACQAVKGELLFSLMGWGGGRHGSPRNAGCVTGCIQPSSQGMQNRVASVWLRNASIER